MTPTFALVFGIVLLVMSAGIVVWAFIEIALAARAHRRRKNHTDGSGA